MPISDDIGKQKLTCVTSLEYPFGTFGRTGLRPPAGMPSHSRVTGAGRTGQPETADPEILNLFQEACIEVSEAKLPGLVVLKEGARIARSV